MNRYAVVTPRLEIRGLRTRKTAEHHAARLGNARIEEYELSAIDELISELNDMIDGGEECKAHDSQITGLIEIARQAKAKLSAVSNAAARESLRLRFLMKAELLDGFVSVPMDRYEYACEVAQERGHDEPTEDDELEGFRRLIDAAIAKEQSK